MSNYITHNYKFFVNFQHADPAGIIFFSKVYDFAHQCLEDFTIKSGIGWEQWFSNSEMAAPLVYSEATYTQPILAGNNSEIKMSINTVSDHSVTFYFEIFQNGKSCSIVKTSHVFISKLNKKKIKVPENFLKIFNSQN